MRRQEILRSGESGGHQTIIRLCGCDIRTNYND